MAKIRVYELARELKMESKVLLTKMKALGIQVPSHQSTLSAAQIEKIRANESQDKPTVVVRRRRKVAAGDSDFQDGTGAGASEGFAEDVESEETPSAHADEVRIEVDEERMSQLAAAEAREKAQAEAAEKARLAAEAQAKAQLEADERARLEAEEKAQAEAEARARFQAEAKAKAQQMMAEVPEHKKVEVIEALARKAEEKEKTRQKLELERGESPVYEAKVGASADDAIKNLKQKKEKSLQADAAKVVRETEGSLKGKDGKRMAPPPPASASAAAPQNPIKKKGFSGATIVRRATPEETQALRAKEEAARQRTSRREDSRGVRVTGIGVNTRMAEPGAPAESRGEVRHAYGEDGEGTGNKWLRERKGEFKKGRTEEEEKLARPVAPVGGKRKLSTRDLLIDADSDETTPEAAAAGRKRRTVYTPTMPQKRREVKRRKELKTTQITTPRAAYRVVKMESPQITVGELAKQLSVKAGELIKKLMGQGIMATVNQTVDFETATLIASEYGFECKNVAKTIDDVLKTQLDEGFKAESRPPIVTVMGHVDHGKTSILDAIRQSAVAAGESGGITQHIGAYMVEREDGARITFLDTPGHAAFSAMRSRGAQLTDIVVLVVAADDGVMPQTIEAISHAKSAGVPIIVAINKIDKHNINLDRVYTELSEHGVQTEEWGGDTQFVKVSALKRTGLDELLDAILLQTEILELKARHEGRAEGVVVEAHLDKGRGPVATVMVTKGTLKIGEFLVAGTVTGRVRAMNNHKGERLQEATPSTPVEVIGLTAVPMSGDQVYVVSDERMGKEAADLRRSQLGEAQVGGSAAASLEELLERVQAADVPEVPMIIKADTQGSVEAIASALDKLNSKRVRNVIVHKAVGGINESDVNLAETSGAVIVGFNVRASAVLFDQADKRGVVIKYYSIIYELVDTVKSLMAGKLPPICTEVIQGHAEVRNAISVPKVGLVAGSAVTDGKITRSSHLRLIRDKVVIYNGRISSLRRFKDDVKEVQHGYECGIAIEGYNDIRIGDVIEAYMIEETAATLEIEG